MYPYLGDFPTGATIFIPFQTFDSSGASVTITGLAVTDIEIYKGASMTQRASDAGYALVDTDGIDLDGVTGIHGFTVDTSDNTDSGFYAAGNDYTVVVSSITADSQTVNFIAARFSIDNRSVTAANLATVDSNVDDVKQMLGHKTTIATLASQTSFTLTAGSADDNAYNGWGAFVIDASTATQVALGVVSDYTGSTKTVTLREDPAIFTMAVSDHIILLPGKLTDGVTLADGAHGGSSMTITAKSIAVTNSDAGGVAVDLVGSGTGNSHALRLQSTNGHGMAIGSTNGNAINAASSASDAVSIAGGTDSDGLVVAGNGAGVDIRADITGTLSELSSAIADSIPADGTIPSVKQALYMLTQFMLERSISGTTCTVAKADGTTALFTLTLDDATTPTSITRAT